MTKEELDRIKKAYSSGLKVQIWFNGYWKDFDIRDYSMYSEPFSENRQYRIIGSDYADIAEKRIAELEQENNKLLDVINNQDVKIADLEEQIKQIEKVSDYNADQLTKAKDIIQNIIRVTWGEGWNYSLDWKVKAEQFLKEIEK